MACKELFCFSKQWWWFFSRFISRHWLWHFASFIGKSRRPDVQDLRLPLPNSTAIKISSLFVNSLPSPPVQNPCFCCPLSLLIEKLNYKKSIWDCQNTRGKNSCRNKLCRCSAADQNLFWPAEKRDKTSSCIIRLITFKTILHCTGISWCENNMDCFSSVRLRKAQT